MHVVPRKSLTLLDRTIIGTLVFLVLLLIGVQVAKAADAPAAHPVAELSPGIHSLSTAA